MFWLWGALGAFVFAINALIFELWNAERTLSRRIRATAEFMAALLTGGIFAQGLTSTLQPYAAHWIKADAVAVALTIGWASNYLWPRVLKKLSDRVDSIGLGGPKT